MDDLRTLPIARTAAWLDDARHAFARGIVEIIDERTRSGAEIGLGYVPSAEATRLARSLAAPGGPPPRVAFEAPADLPVCRLLRAADLPPAFAGWAALMLLAETDARWGTLLAWLNDAPGARLPTAGLLCELAGPPGLPLPDLLAPDAPLRALALITERGADMALPDRPLQWRPHVAHWLLGDAPRPAFDPALAGHLEDVPDTPLAALTPGPELTAAQEPHAPRRLVLTGGAGRGRALIARAMLGDAPVLDGERLSGTPNPAELLRIALRDATLRGSGLILAEADRLDAATLTATLERAPCPVALTAARRLPLDWPTFAVPALDHARTRALWRHGLGRGAEGTADRMSHQFRLPATDILRVAAETRGQPEEAVARACLSRSATRLDRFATVVDCRQDWTDLVLPSRQYRLLHSIVQRVRHAGTVYDRWGFAEKLAPSRGVTALFTGPSGAGKTLSAGIVARDLGLPLYRVDLSVTVSKYIGETEKQLEQIFSAAEAGNACLFFDECDALFGKRTEVSDAHDRYANIEVSYLLQRLETHRGIVFLATNHPKNIDEAFTRRIDLAVDFPMPSAALRAELWRRLLPPAASAGIDADRLGRQFELSGGSIRNCLVTAAFLAAAEGEAPGIETRHCLLAVAQEYEKIGRPLTRSDFGEAFELLRPARTLE